MTKADTPLLEIENLTVEFDTASGNLKAVDGVSLSVHEREVLAIVGESGSGKSVSMLAVMGLLPWTARVTADALRFQGRDISNLTSSERRKLVGKDVAMIFQEPIASLNPCFTVGFQIDETLREHTKLNKRERRDRTIELFEAVGLPNPADRLSAYPHQMSGGQCQRVMIAMAIACDPKLLIADEPTTALDVTIQKQILDLLVDLQAEKNMGMIMITHDMGVVAETADRVIVKYKGRKMEEADVLSLFENPQNSYTKALLSALPENATGDRLPTVTDLTFEQQANPEASA
jgi:dipeptide transport system ATP-binding protein